MLVVITATKFVHGAWIVIAAMPFLVVGMFAVHRHYAGVASALRSRHLVVSRDVRHRFVVLVADTGAATHEAVAQVRALRPAAIAGLYVGRPAGFEAATRWWSRVVPRAGRLQRLPEIRGGSTARLRAWLSTVGRDASTFVTVVVPEEVVGTSFWRLLTTQRRALLLKARLLFTPGVAVMDVPLVPEEREEADQRAGLEQDVVRTVVLVPIAAVHDGTVRAVSFASALQATHTEALYFADDPEVVHDLAREWWQAGGDIPLSFVEAPFRDLGPPLLHEVRRHTAREDTVVTVVLPEFLVTRWWEHLLHGQTALFLKRLLLAEPRTNVVSVPYRVAPERRI